MAGRPHDIDFGPVLNELRDLIRTIPFRDGEQFVRVELSLTDPSVVDLYFGLRSKCEMGALERAAPERALAYVRDELIPRMNMRSLEDEIDEGLSGQA